MADITGAAENMALSQRWHSRDYEFGPIPWGISM
jgi:hypothetical protein